MSKFRVALNAIKNRKPEEKPKRITKSRNPDYQQITAYLPQDIYHELKVALAEDRKEMSELFEEMIRQWLKSRKSGKR